MPSVSTQTEEPVKYRRRISYRQRFISRRRELHLRRIAYRPRVTHQKRPVKFEFPLADLCGELLEKIITKVITINEVLLGYSDLTKKQIQIFLEITKPTKISLDISHAYEILLQSKTLKSAEISLEMDSVVDVMTKYLAKFSSAKLRLVHHTPVQLSFLRTILNVLFSEYLPQLRYFDFFLAWDPAEIPPEVEVKQLFHGFSLKLVGYGYCSNVYEVELPQYFPPDAICQITMGEYTCKIVYTCGPGAKE